MWQKSPEFGQLGLLQKNCNICRFLQYLPKTAIFSSLFCWLSVNFIPYLEIGVQVLRKHKITQEKKFFASRFVIFLIQICSKKQLFSEKWFLGSGFDADRHVSEKNKTPVFDISVLTWFFSKECQKIYLKTKVSKTRRQNKDEGVTQQTVWAGRKVNNNMIRTI